MSLIFHAYWNLAGLSYIQLTLCYSKVRIKITASVWIFLGLERHPKGLGLCNSWRKMVFIWEWKMFLSRVNNSVNFWIAVAVSTFGIDQGQTFSREQNWPVRSLMRQILALITILLASNNERKNMQPTWKEEHICLGHAGFLHWYCLC